MFLTDDEYQLSLNQVETIMILFWGGQCTLLDRKLIIFDDFAILLGPWEYFCIVVLNIF